MIHDKGDDLPPYLKWTMTFINRVGFPILVCMWLAYQQFTGDKELLRELQDFKQSFNRLVESVERQNSVMKEMIEQQNRTLRRSTRDE